MRLLALTKYGDLGASSRLRFGQFAPYLAANGWEISVSPLFDDEYLRILYREGRRSPGRVALAGGRRISAALSAGSYDVIWLEKELLPWVPEWIEQLLRRRCKRLVVDLDDAVFHSYDNNRHRLVRKALGTKVDRVMASADLVMVCNTYLESRALAAGAQRVEMVPTVVDSTRYVTNTAPGQDRWTVGWIGSSQTLPYLVDVADVFTDLARAAPMTLLVVGADAPAIDGVDVMARAWTLDSEAELLSMMNVGVMPLRDGSWERGKCGYKLIQYMAAGLPVVASPVGVNPSIVVDGETGFLATSHEEWLAALTRLRNDRVLGNEIGAAGRSMVESEFDLATTAPRVADLLESVL